MEALSVRIGKNFVSKKILFRLKIYIRTELQNVIKNNSFGVIGAQSWDISDKKAGIVYLWLKIRFSEISEYKQ